MLLVDRWRAAPATLRPRQVQPALALVLALPPPAPGALRLAGLDSARAGGAADRRETLRVQRVDRDGMAPDEVQELSPRPVEQRVELDQAALRIGGDQRHVATMRGLL